MSPENSYALGVLNAAILERDYAAYELDNLHRGNPSWDRAIEIVREERDALTRIAKHLRTCKSFSR